MKHYMGLVATSFLTVMLQVKWHDKNLDKNRHGIVAGVSDTWLVVRTGSGVNDLHYVGVRQILSSKWVEVSADKEEPCP